MILIRNVKIVDGSGKPAYPADALIQGDKISALGNFRNKKVEHIIEGLGGYLTPGFIDVHSSFDRTLRLFSHSSCNSFLKQGITSVIIGHEGLSLAPLLYGSLESMNMWNDSRDINISWHTVAELCATLRSLSLGVNVGVLVGHTTIRQALIGDDCRDLTNKEMHIFKEIIHRSLHEGALGMSTDVNHIGSCQTPYHEIKELVSVLSHYHAIYSARLRYEHNGINESVSRILKLYRETGVKTMISHLKPCLGYDREYDLVYKTIDTMTDGMDCYYEACPSEFDIIPFYELLPSWARKETLGRTMEYVSRDDINFDCDENCVIIHAPHNPRLVGTTITSENFVHIIRITKLHALVVRRSVDVQKNDQLLFSDKALIASCDTGLQNIESDTFMRYFHLISSQKKYSFEQAIRKITALPADFYAIKNRGYIREGYQADINVIVNDTVQTVIVNGQVAMHKGTFLSTSSGNILQRS